MAHARDGVYAEVRPRAVRGPPGRLELEGDEALVGERESHLGRLGDHGAVRAVALGDPRRADARHLLVADRSDEHVAAEPAAGRFGAPRA